MVIESRLASALVQPLRNAGRITDLIAGLTSNPLVEVRCRLRREHEEMGINVREAMQRENIEPWVWSERLERFYAQTDSFLYETVVWNLTHAKCELRSWIGDFLQQAKSLKSILAFGDGLGFDSFYLAEKGYEVTYFEVSGPCSRFAQTIFREHGQDVEVIVDSEEVGKRRFDAIMCLDVLEHVPDPRSLVQWLAGMLNPGGILIVSAPFYLINSKVQTHLKSNRRFSGDWRQLFAPAGLFPVAGRIFWNPVVFQRSGQPNRANQPIPANIRLGGALLKLARIWSLPFSLCSNAIVRKKHPLDFRSRSQSTD